MAFMEEPPSLRAFIITAIIVALIFIGIGYRLGAYLQS